MQKKVNVNDLNTGMYVCELDRPWTETPFLFQGFVIASEQEIKELKQCCEYIYIDTDRQTGTAAQLPDR